MRRIFGKEAVVKAAAGTRIAAPPSAAPYGESHRSYHADKREQTDDGIEET